MEGRTEKAHAFPKGHGYRPHANVPSPVLSSLGIPGSSHYASGHYSDLIGQSTSFNPREVGKVAEIFGVSQGVLANMPMAKCPEALSTNLLPYQRQGLAWILDKESPKHPEMDSKDILQLWKRFGQVYLNVAANYPRWILLLFSAQVFWPMTWVSERPFKSYSLSSRARNRGHPNHPRPP